MLGKRDSYILHSLSNRIPEPEELAVNKLAIVFYDNDSPVLYTKDFTGKVLEIGKGVTNFSDLQDVDLTNAKDGSFFIKRGDKFIASNQIGSISSLTDVELINPQPFQYLRYNSSLEAYSNYYPSYYLHELLDVEVADPFDEDESQDQDNQTLYYQHSTGKYKTRPRLNRINQLVDVEIIPTNDAYQILALDASDGIWKNSDLKIEYDPNPRLGNHLNASGLQIRNSTYRVNTVQCNQAIVNIDYAQGDYWILQGYPKEVINQCIVNVNINIQAQSTAVLMLELRQDTGTILLGNLPNVKYEDGKPLRLSGAGKTDLVTVTLVRTPNPALPAGNIVTYITVAALNLSTQGQGGALSWRYDKNRYPFVQQFATINRYDDYFDYVESFLTFEPEVSTEKTWLEDKAIRVSSTGDVLPTAITSTGTRVQTEKYLLGIPDGLLKLDKGISTETLPVNSLTSSYQYVQAIPSTPIVLVADFTIELYINYPNEKYKQATTSSSDIHYLFSNQTSNTGNRLSLAYKPYWSNTSQTTDLQLQIGNSVYILYNAYTYFVNKADDFYTHICIQRRQGQIELYIDGVVQLLQGNMSNSSTFNIARYLVASEVNVSALRITNNIARYSPNLLLTPSVRFGLVGGANDILDRQVFNNYFWLDRDLEHEIFCS